MKKIKKFSLLISLIFLAFCCNKEDKEKELEKEVVIEVEENEEVNDSFDIVGLWVEKFPELHDHIADTLIFTSDNIIKEHFFFDGFQYNEKPDTIIIFKDEYIRKYFFQIESASEMIIFSFLDRSPLTIEKNIHYQKI
jgi:hypothetical protein